MTHAHSALRSPHARSGPSRGTAPLLAAFAGILTGVLAVEPAAAQTAARAVDAGNTAWMTIASALVLLMATPGLALLYAGLVRTKNVVSVLTQVMVVVCMCCVLWIAYGYSLVFSSGPFSAFIGGFGKALLRGVDVNSMTATGVPEYLFVAFQMMFACIAPAILIGAFAERMRFSAVVLLAALWFTFVYLPIAHMSWYGASYAELSEAARAIASAKTAEARAAAEAAFASLQQSAGLFKKWGAIDFAGGTVVHINAGIAGLVAAVIIGPRLGYGRDNMAPHSLSLTMIGAALMWVGWIGFNGGSTFAADGGSALAVVNTILAGASGALAWILVEQGGRGKPSLIGLISGLLAGLVAITPCARHIAPLGALSLGMVAGAVSYWFCIHVKSRFAYDDALDVFGIHCIGGIIGSIGLAVVASPLLGGLGHLGEGATAAGSYSIVSQLIAQAKAVLVTMLWSAYMTAMILWGLDRLIGLRLEEDDEDQGLDLADHGERAYHY